MGISNLVKIVSWIVFSIQIVRAPLAFGFQLIPTPTPLELKLPKYTSGWEQIVEEGTIFGIHYFTQAVHEEITHRIYGCNDSDSQICDPIIDKIEYAPIEVRAGVEWNDNPPFQVKTGFKECIGKTIRLPARKVTCWVKVFKDAEKKARGSKQFNDQSGHALLYRVHFSDLQFLHAMASKNDEPPTETLRHVMMWVEFTYRFALGEIPVDKELRTLDIDGMKAVFSRKQWTTSQLFTLGDPTYRPTKKLRLFAFGSLLHMLEDSFAKGHVQRDEPTGGQCPSLQDMSRPGAIRVFHSYTHQDPVKHNNEDSRNSFVSNFLQSNPSVVDVGRKVRMLFEKEKTWIEVKPYFECIFALAVDAEKSGPGEEFQSE